MFTGISPIILFVKDFKKSLRFYRNILGLKLESMDSPDEEFATFRIGDLVFAIHGGYKGKRGGPINIHFVVEDIHSAVKKLRTRGVKFIGSIERMPWGAYQTTFVDPDGNQLDIMQHPESGPIM